MKNIESRLEILNTLHKAKLTVVIEDLIPDQDQGTGTRVTIQVPKLSDEKHYEHAEA